ncbi:hypothetical protein DSM110093_03761 (plasmid) [Sulfitobacter sp. DSM 110093]|uniref:TRAP transporter permease n=1 Tax=Sulfitobacter sp. DSM 110093 TaxID=2883127 RepID=UPI001FACE76C|nr:TRAP transporter fused permease subunit [Sulfitobacter sp. DSM 110093]UOA33665.1 hypothetical protein DSM110093_03500 [Sulfitobacter sp. DSM 110093]UOA33926.1 hypothetical protein DSM110093_03761 [Sulfitobacter sp. DSM 110093]
MTVDEIPARGRSRFADLCALIFGAVTVVLAAGFFFLDPVLNRILHIGLGFLMLFAMQREAPDRLSRAIGTIGIVGIVLVTAYAYYWYPQMWQFAGLPPSSTEIGLGLIALLMALVAAWRVAGPSIPIIALFFIVYTLAGANLPAPFSHAGLDFTQIVQALFLTGRGIYGSITGVSASYIVLFVLFAAYLGQLGFIDFLLVKSQKALGRTRGGPAKVAVIASGSLGAVMGTAYGNTASTGAFTIPLMKRTGFSGPFAAAVEATASVGGQFVPPILGGAAFLMVDILGITYTNVMLASIPLAIMFYLSIFVMVDLRAARDHLAGVETTNLSDAIDLKDDFFFGGWLKFLPIIVLIAMLVQGYTPPRAGFYAFCSIALVDLAENRSLVFAIRNLFQGLIEGARNAAVIVGIIAAAGIIAGLTSTTGLGLVLSQILEGVAGESLPLLLVLTAITSIILGLGLPTIVCYLLMAVLVAPALISSGVEPMVAHLFLIYFAALSSITPPVGPSNFIAASIAGKDTNPMKVGMIAVQLALPGFIVPFVFVYHPELLLTDGITFGITYSLLTACIGIYALAAAQVGMVLPGHRAGGWLFRGMLMLGALALIWPGGYTDILGFSLLGLVHILALRRNGNATYTAAKP